MKQLKSLFRKQKKPVKFENPLQDVAIILKGQKIIPVYNKKVEAELGKLGIKLFKKHPKAKQDSMRVTDLAVYLSIKEGARKQGINFDYTLNSLFYHITIQDYLITAEVIRKALNISPIFSSEN